MNVSLSIMLWAVVATLLGVYFWNRTWGVLLFFALKSTLDLFWAHELLNVFGVAVNISKTMSVVGIGMMLHLLILGRRDALTSIKHGKPILLFVLLGLVSTIWGLSINEQSFRANLASPLTLALSLDILLRVVFACLFYLSVSLIIDSERRIRHLSLVFACSAIIPIGLAVFQLVGLDGAEKLAYSWSQQVKRIATFYHDSNALAYVCFVGVAFSSLSLNLSKSVYTRAGLVLLLIFGLVVLFFTYSRAVLLGAVLFFFFWFLLNRRYWMAALALVAPVIVFVFSSELQSRLTTEMTFLASLFGNEINPDTVKDFKLTEMGSGRIWLWLDAIRHYSRFDPISKVIGLGMNFDSHNTFIAILLRNGMAGLCMSIVLTFFFGRSVYRQYQRYSVDTPGKTEMNFNNFAVSFLIAVAFVGLFVNLPDKITLVTPAAAILSIHVGRPLLSQKTNESTV